MRSALLLTLPALIAPAQIAPVQATTPKPIPAPKTTSLINVRVDQRFELLCIVCRLAGFGEYRTGQFEDYVVAVDTHFAPFQFHPAVKLLQQQRKNSVAYDAIPNLAIRVKDARSFEPILPLSDPATGLDKRWNVEATPAFLKAMADFAKDTKAEAFFTSQAPTYAKLVDACQKGLVNHLDLEWYGRTFGNTQIANTFTLGLEPLLSAGYARSRPSWKTRSKSPMNRMMFPLKSRR